MAYKQADNAAGDRLNKFGFVGMEHEASQ